MSLARACGADQRHWGLGYTAIVAIGLLLQACALLPQAEPPPSPSTRPAPVIASKQRPTDAIDIKEAQRALLELGYYEAGVDGIVGPKTKAAVRAFQRNRKLQITGDLTPDLVRTIVNSAAGARQRLSSFIGLAQPVYESGDQFHYTDGTSETVLSLEDGRVVWESSDGTRRTTPWNFILPPFAWYGEDGSGSAEADISPDILWPLKPGSETRYSVSATMVESGPAPDSIFELWHCRVRSVTRVSVPAGTFDTLPIQCAVFRQPSGPKRT
ncbi:MAG: peptidoglycan-binding protein, partial [Rhodospirillales bacterium]|nr:peptidoglycan-binding protein [Rhodospirillales bacterium]